jgi:hypothetical protein
MFAPDSRYRNQPTIPVTAPDGTSAAIVLAPRPTFPPLLGFHRTTTPGRLDLVAVQYLNAPTGFWRLCDANRAMLASSLAARELVAIPAGSGR